MTPLHPHWQSTEDEQPVAIHTRQNAVPAASVSRMPAAIVGIALTLATVLFATGGWNLITGQVSNPTPDVTIRLTQAGAEPQSVNIQAGQTIRFVNEDQIPHVITSETLPTADGTEFTSTAIFPQSDFFYTVPMNAAAGTHTYMSETSEDVEGEIVIGGSAPTSAATSTSSQPGTIVTSSASSIASTPVIGGQASSVPPLGGNVIAVNPYVVGSKIKPGVTQHKPIKNAESGPEIWIAITLSGLAVVIATRKAFKAV